MTSKTLGAGLAAIFLSSIGFIGCSLTGPIGSRPKEAVAPPVVGGREALGVKRVVLRMMIASRPQGDPGLGEALWSVADEQALDPESRRILQANGLRFGRVTGDLPKEVQDVLSAPPPRKIDTQTIILPEGIATVLDPGTAETANVSLMLGQKDKIVGKVYESARGFLRVTGTFQGENGIALRIVPELHHGPVQKGWAVEPGATSMAPAQIIPRSGQKDDSFRDLASTLVLQPGQVAVLAGRHEKRGSLGNFLFSTVENDSNRPVERVIFLWAGRSDGSQSAPGDSPLPGLVPIDPVESGKENKETTQR